MFTIRGKLMKEGNQDIAINDMCLHVLLDTCTVRTVATHSKRPEYNLILFLHISIVASRHLFSHFFSNQSVSY